MLKITNPFKRKGYLSVRKTLQYDILYQGAFPWIVGVKVQTPAFLAELGFFYNEIAYGYQVSYFAELWGYGCCLVERFYFLVEEVQSFHGPLEAGVCPDDPYIVAHQEL